MFLPDAQLSQELLSRTKHCPHLDWSKRPERPQYQANKTGYEGAHRS